MNATLSTATPLPAILNQPAAAGPGRRHRIENVTLTPFDLDRFNNLLLRLGSPRPPLGCDQLVTAARELCDRSILAVEPPSIRERMRRMETAARMLNDRDWAAANDANNTAQLVVDYAAGSDNLIPDWVPKVGHLDDAIVIDAAWPRLADEIDDYLDFCRLRAFESATPAGSVPQRFNRGDWQRARREEAALVAHQNSVRGHSYLAEPAALFHVH